MKLLILSILIFSTNCNATFNDCNLWYSYVLNLKNEITNLGYGSIDMDKTFSKINKNESISDVTSSFLTFERKYSLPFYSNSKNQSLKLIFSNKDNDKGFFYKSKDIKLFSIISKKVTINNIYIPIALQVIHGYSESIKDFNDYEATVIQFENKFSDLSCKKLNKNWLYYAYPFFIKSTSSFAHTNWYHISKDKFDLIVSKSEKFINMKFYLKNEIIEINIEYRKGINNSKFENWLGFLKFTDIGVYHGN